MTSWKDENLKNTFLKKLTSRIKTLLLVTGILSQKEQVNKNYSMSSQRFVTFFQLKQNGTV